MITSIGLKVIPKDICPDSVIYHYSSLFAGPGPYTKAHNSTFPDLIIPFPFGPLHLGHNLPWSCSSFSKVISICNILLANFIIIKIVFLILFSTFLWPLYCFSTAIKNIFAIKTSHFNVTLKQR